MQQIKMIIQTLLINFAHKHLIRKCFIIQAGIQFLLNLLSRIKFMKLDVLDNRVWNDVPNGLASPNGSAYFGRGNVISYPFMDEMNI